MAEDRKKRKMAGDKNITLGGGEFVMPIGGILGKETGNPAQRQPAEKEPEREGTAGERKKPETGIDNLRQITLHRQSAGKGGKTVTVVTFSQQSEPNLEYWAKEMRKGLGCGSRVENGKIVLQGDIQERARGWLIKKGAKKVIPGN